MPKRQIDVGALVLALDTERTVRGLSWRGLAAKIGVSPSLLARMRNGYKPDADGFVTLVGWLGMETDSFLTAPSPGRRRNPDFATTLAPLLRAETDLEETDVFYIQQIVMSAQRRAEARRSDDENQQE